MFKDVAAEEEWSKIPTPQQTRERLNTLTLLVDASGSGSFAYRKATRCVISLYELDRMSMDAEHMMRTQKATRVSLKVKIFLCEFIQILFFCYVFPNSMR